jgi:transposase InsO family protein
MISKWLSAKEIAEFTGKAKRVINRRAVEECWVSRSVPVRGGYRRLYQLSGLPEDIRSAYAESLEVSFEALQSRLKPAVIVEKKAFLANHNGRTVSAGDVPPLEKVSADKRRVANLRVKVLLAWDASGKSAERFLFEYNAGNIASEVRAELGGKTICQATLYNWLAKYQNHDEAGLAPKYKGRGGNGASLDEHTKSLIWFYFLHKNKPTVAQVLRKLENENIEVSESVVRRYINSEIDEGTKAYFRKGKKYFHDHFECHVNIDYTRYYSMQLVVYDHKTLDFASRVLRDGEWKRARLVLTCVIDKRSRMILGWWIDDVPSTLTIIRATRMMVEKYGCPDGAQFDNGKDFTSHWFTGYAWEEKHNKFGTKERKAVSCITDDLGCSCQFTEPYHGQSKHIERLFGFIAGEFDKSFESYLGSNTSDRHDESRLYVGSFEGAAKRPIDELPTIEETRALFAKFADWFNAKWKHSGQGMNGKTPEQVFNENRKTRRDLPLDFAKYVWTRREVKTVQRNGVSHEGGWYYSPAMQAIVGQEVELRVSIDDLGAAYIFNLQGEFLYEAASEFKDSGITEENVRNVRRLRKSAKKHLEQYQSAIENLRKDKKTQLEELRDSGGDPRSIAGYAPLVMNVEDKKVACGEPLAAIGKRRLRLPTDPD